MKRGIAMLMLLMLVPLMPVHAEETAAYTWKSTETATVYESESLKYSIEIGKIDATKVYVTRIWMAEPGQQIKKAANKWHQKLAGAEALGRSISKAAFVINGSGYVSPLYPWIPENYPGTSEDYYYTPLGSLAITDGKVYRNLEGVPYYGLTLEADGLHMYVGADNEEVLAKEPTQTWSFYEQCPLIQDGVSILDRSWDFANRKAIRTVIAKLDANNYVVLTVTSVHGLSLLTCTDFLLGEFQPEWAYNLDGGPSTTMMRRKHGMKTLKLIYGSQQKVVDVMGFIELPAKTKTKKK